MNRCYTAPPVVSNLHMLGGLFDRRVALRVTTAILALAIGTNFPRFTAARVLAQAVPSAEATSPKVVAASTIQSNQPKQEPGLAIIGKVLDPEARPVVGATIRLAQALRANGDDLTLWIDAVRRRRFAAARTYLYTPRPPSPKQSNLQRRLTQAAISGWKVSVASRSLC